MGHIDITDTNYVTFKANAMTIRPNIVNQAPTGTWVVIIGDGTIRDTVSGLKSAGVYLESAAYHVNDEGYEFLFYTTFRTCNQCSLGYTFPTTATTSITGYTGEGQFGFATALSETHLVVGAWAAKKAYIFKKDGSGNYPTTATASITAYTADAYFGVWLALSETHLVVGAEG